MRPIPIPKATIEKGVALGWEAHIIAGPDGDLTSDAVRPVEALVGVVRTSDGLRPEFNVLIQIEEDDWRVLEKHGRRFWITFVGHIVPFSVSTFDPDTDEVDTSDAPNGLGPDGIEGPPRDEQKGPE